MRNNPHWRGGYRAYDEGRGINCNPFDPDINVRCWMAWHEGWKAAEEDDYPIDDGGCNG